MLLQNKIFDKYMVENAEDNEPEAMFKRILADEPSLSHVLRRAKFDTPVRTLVGYSANVKHLAGHNYALLGNAGEFLDPVFSSGVTIALKSSSLAVPLVERVLQGQQVDWLEEYENHYAVVFRCFVPMLNHGTKMSSKMWCFRKIRMKAFAV